MWTSNFFPASYFAPRYWPRNGAAIIVTLDLQETRLEWRTPQGALGWRTRRGTLTLRTPRKGLQIE